MTAMRRIIKSRQHLRARGVTLVELLVAMVISLIAITAIFQVFSVFEGQKRTTMGGGEAQTNGALALFTLERELRQAGYGVNSTDYLGCNTLVWDDTTGTAFTLNFTPVQITQGAGEAPDTLTVLYGNGEFLPQAVSLIQTMANDTNPFRVSNRFGFQEGDVVIAAETGLNCTVGQVNNLPSPLGQQDLVLHTSGNYTDPLTGANTATRYNKPGGLGVAYTFNGRLFNLGQKPSYNIYTVQNGQLAVQQMLSAPSTAVTTIYDGIVQLQAQYGRDTNADGVIDVFDEFVPATAADWATILAVRIGVVSRSGLYEKTEVSPATIKLWDDSAAAPTTTGPVWTLTADERHYRYKVFQTVVPIRNMIWRP
jgi:type IV pilus assembly protein PilW